MRDCSILGCESRRCRSTSGVRERWREVVLSTFNVDIILFQFMFNLPTQLQHTNTNTKNVVDLNLSSLQKSLKVVLFNAKNFPSAVTTEDGRKFLTAANLKLRKACRLFIKKIKMDLNANYYDHPDGKDAFGKMVATNKYAAAAGLGISTIDVLMVSKPQGYLPTLARYAFFTGTAMGMASAFTLGTYAACNLRGKDDKINYVIGAYCAGGVYGAWRKSVVSGLVAGTFFAIAGVVKKMSIEQGWEFFPDIKMHGYGSLHGSRHDYTLMAERPKNWTTGKE